MIDKIFLDTNILVYLFDKTEKQKQSRAKELIAEYISGAKVIISVQVINEFINITSKKITFPISLSKQKEIIEFLNDLFIISSLTFDITLRAIETAGRYQLSYWDSLIISSALDSTCNILFSEDMQNGLLIDGKLKIVNPFL